MNALRACCLAFGILFVIGCSGRASDAEFGAAIQAHLMTPTASDNLLRMDRVENFRILRVAAYAQDSWCVLASYTAHLTDYSQGYARESTRDVTAKFLLVRRPLGGLEVDADTGNRVC